VLEPPDGDEWTHEIKYDGYRTQIVIDGSGVRAFTRNGFDWSARYREVLAAADI
jgi:ATP-dependent DNA ligase